MIEVLKLLEQDGRLTPAQIASMLSMEQAEVEAILAQAPPC